ncbi:MAG: DNA gyrase C-terminal beta-propeller domain-containing protein [Chloroflexota bacterium]|nr:DNA gyrase C-terminal beta-propeller domain-containing protein [Chloroflexota bacterium]
MIRKGDIQWWVLEAKKHPESAPTIIEELANRLAELDAENERLRDKAIRLQRRAPAAAESAEVSALRDKVATLQALLDGEAYSEPSVVFLSNRLKSARLPLSRVQQLAREDQPVLGRQAMLAANCLLLAQPHNELLLLTNQGRGFEVLLPGIPTLVEGGNWPSAESQELAAGERVTAAVAVAKPPRFWTVVTRRGYVRQLLRIDFDRRVEQGDQLLASPFSNDSPVSLVNGDRGDLLLVTRWGKGVRFPQQAIEGQGSVALELESDDEIVAALRLLSDTNILVVTAAGYAIRRNTDRIEARSRPGGSGKMLVQAYDVLGLFPCEPQARLLYLTYSGKLVLVPTADIPLHQRSSKGTRVRDFGRDPAVAVALVPGAF